MLLTSTQAAQRLGCSPRTVHRLVLANELEAALKLPGPNGAFLFDPDEIDAYRQQRDAAA